MEIKDIEKEKKLLEKELQVMQASVSSKTIPSEQTPGTRLEGGKNLPSGTIVVYETPLLGTKQGVKSPTHGT